MSRLRRVVGAGLLVGAVLAGVARAQADTEAQRQRIGVERATALETYERKAHECQARFAVTTCVLEAQRERRATMAALRQQETVLDEAQR